MSSTRFFITFLLNLLLFNNALGDGPSDLWVEGKIQELEHFVQKAGCQQYVSHSYKYEHMFNLEDVYLDNTVVKKENGELKEFKMHVAVKTQKDAIFILSPINWPWYKDRVFEIAIGVEGNTNSVIRLGMDGGDYVVRVATPNILSDKKYKKFYIILSNDVLTVGEEGEKPLMTYTDVGMRSIKHFDMTTWGNNNAKFLYDCPPPVED